MARVTKQEVYEVVVRAASEAIRKGNKGAIDHVVDALWEKFIFFHQGAKAELPEASPELDSAAEAPVCATCGNRWGGFIKIAPGVFLCPQCLDGKRKESAEAREFWEKVVIARIENPPSDWSSVSQFADQVLAKWLERFGERSA